MRRTKRLSGKFNIIKLVPILVLVVLIGLGLANVVLNKNIYNKIASKPIVVSHAVNAITSTPTMVVPTDTPTPTPIPDVSCTFGQITLNLSQALCDKEQAIDLFRKQDSDEVQSIIDNLSSKINILFEQANGYISQMKEDTYASCEGMYPPGTNPSFFLECAQTIQSGIMSRYNLVQSELNPLINQKNIYVGYLNEIKNGVGNGACSDHMGVNCAAGRTNIGQVICNDGWSNSSVYYFNVKECLTYYLSSN
jgi:hypothetical protein